MSLPMTTIEMEHGGCVSIALYPDVAPNTAKNFASLVSAGFYDGLTFHRIIPGFMIQGGCPAGTGAGGPEYRIAGEFRSNGFPNELLHERGVISMARSSHPDSAGSQFFIMVSDAPHLDGAYAAFGRVTDGMDIVDAIVAQERDAADRPLVPQRIRKVEITMNGWSLGSPDVISGR